MTDFTKVQISAKIYWGFSVDFDNKRLKNMGKKDIINEIKLFMKSFFHIHNLEELKEGIDKLNLHIHQDIILGQTIYVCDSC
jgi:hypothetical protein